MDLTIVESRFLDMIKASSIEYSKKAGICPSVIAAVGYIKSSHGNDPMLGATNNIYKLTTKNSWYKKVYSKDSKKIYDDISSCNEVGPILYRVYDSYDESIRDYIDFLLSIRRSKDGPLKYESIIGCTNYRDTVDKLVRAGYMQDQFNTINNIVDIENIIATIENLELYKWDNLLEDNSMSNNSKKKRPFNVVNKQIEENKEEVIDEVEENEEVSSSNEDLPIEPPLHMYRVRLDWENPDTQIFATDKYEDAVEEASKHSGYKVFIDDDGEVFCDPWIKKEEPEVVDGPVIKSVLLPVAGKAITLINTPVYDRIYSTKPYTFLTGTYYFYDYEVSESGRVRITDRKDITSVKKKTPSMIVGYIVL